MKVLRITASDGSRWDVPVEVIARDRAKHYAHEFDGDVEKSLAEDTMPLFDSDNYEIRDWAANNMNWSDVKDVAVLAAPAEGPDMNDAWCNGEYEIAEAA